MTKRALRANARTLPEATPHPDAAIFELAEKCVAANQRYLAAADAFDEAEGRKRENKAPATLIKTDEDAKMRLFVLGCTGETYDGFEVEAIGAILRSLRYGGAGSCPAYRRGRNIIESWIAWSGREKAEEARSGYDAADRAQKAALNEASHLGTKLAMTRASTIDGLLAKVRTFEAFCGTKGLGGKIEREINEFGVFVVEPLALSFAYDLFTLVGAEARS